MINKSANLDEILQILRNKTVLTMDDAVILTGLSKTYLYKLTSKGILPHYKPGGKVIYFKREELEAWMTSNRRSSFEERARSAATYLTTH